MMPATAIAALAYAVVVKGRAAPTETSAPYTAAPDDTVPTADYLKAHPAALAEAQKRCDVGNGQNVVTLCDAVHDAKASLMSDQFRKGPAGGPK